MGKGYNGRWIFGLGGKGKFPRFPRNRPGPFLLYFLVHFFHKFHVDLFYLAGIYWFDRKVNTYDNKEPLSSDRIAPNGNRKRVSIGLQNEMDCYGADQKATRYNGNVVLEILQNSQETTVPELRPATLLKKRLWHRCFSVNFAKFLRTRFLQNTSGRLLLDRIKRSWQNLLCIYLNSKCRNMCI